jgi:SARP family transcriptional regulator, regulator of embCAB operon
MIDIEVLGPLRVARDGRDIAPSAAKPRAMLALLACDAGSTVLTEAIIEELWGDDVPRSATTTLQTYVMQVRNHISAALVEAGEPADAARAVLVTRGRGYELTVGPEGTDLTRYESWSDQGLRAAERGDRAVALRSLRAALDLWRGPALAGVRTGSLLAAHVARLEESRLSLLVQALHLELQVGNHDQVVGELAALADRHPMHETLHGLYMLALYRAGRRERALQIYRRLRATLDESLGLEPLSSVQRLQRAMLTKVPGPELLALPIGA